MTLLAVEGTDGAGKSTLVADLVQFLSRTGVDVVTEHEPSNSKFGRKLKHSFSSGDRFSPTKETELFRKDREIHVKQFINPNLEAGKTVVLDRYYYSTAAYQGALGMDPEIIIADNELFAPRPDIVFVLDVSPKVAVKRMSGRDLSKEPSGQQKIRTIFQKISLSRHQYFVLVPTDFMSQKEVLDFVCRYYLQHS